MAMSEGRLRKYVYYCEWDLLELKCLHAAFPTGFFDRNGRSQRWLRDFHVRCNVEYMRRASGTVYVLTDDAVPPDFDCSYFSNMVTSLQQNMKVDRIMLVGAQDWNLQYEYWKRPRQDDGNDLHPLNAAAATSVLVGAGAGTINALKSLLIDPAWRLFFGNGQDQNPKDPAVKTDVLFSPVASLSSFDDPVGPASGDTSQINGMPDIGDGFKAADQPAVKENLDFTTFSRRRRALFPRDGGGCMGWVDPDFLDNPSQSDGPSPPNPGAETSTAAAAQADFNFAKLNLLGKEKVYTLKVTQYHDPSAAPGHYKLDISILDPYNKPIHYEQGVDARAGQKIEVPVPPNPHLPVDSLIGHPYPVYVTMGKNDDDPIEIAYGDPTLIGNQANWGLQFDSQNSKCTVGAWTDSQPRQRTIRCSFIVAHLLDN